jgi:hypothetical protein
VSAAPATASTTKSEFDYVNEPGGFALYATVGPLHLQASKLDASMAASNVRIRTGDYDVNGGQLVAIGSPVAPATLSIALTDPEAALSPSSPLALASTQFSGGTVVLTYGGLVLHANLSSLKRTSGGTASAPAPDGGSDGGSSPVPPIDGGNVVHPGPPKDGGIIPLPVHDGGKDTGAGVMTTP